MIRWTMIRERESGHQRDNWLVSSGGQNGGKLVPLTNQQQSNEDLDLVMILARQHEWTEGRVKVRKERNFAPVLANRRLAVRAKTNERTKEMKK